MQGHVHQWEVSHGLRGVGGSSRQCGGGRKQFQSCDTGIDLLGQINLRGNSIEISQVTPRTELI